MSLTGPAALQPVEEHVEPDGSDDDSQVVPAAPNVFQFTGVNIAERSVSLGWATVQGAQRYIIEAGSESGASDLATMELNAPAGMATLSAIPPSATRMSAP